MRDYTKLSSYEKNKHASLPSLFDPLTRARSIIVYVFVLKKMSLTLAFSIFFYSMYLFMFIICMCVYGSKTNKGLSIKTISVILL